MDERWHDGEDGSQIVKCPCFPTWLTVFCSNVQSLTLMWVISTCSFSSFICYLSAGQNHDLNCLFSCASPPGKNPIPSSRPSSNASSVAQLCPGAPGTVNHVLLHVLSVLYSYCYRGTDHIWCAWFYMYHSLLLDCELLGHGGNFHVSFWTSQRSARYLHIVGG